MCVCAGGGGGRAVDGRRNFQIDAVLLGSRSSFIPSEGTKIRMGYNLTHQS